jgi:adenine-specific DNA glycosylase
LPRSRCDLERLPGIGPYTASAVKASVYGLHEPLVDVNMARVLSRFFCTQACAASVRSASLYTLYTFAFSCLKMPKKKRHHAELCVKPQNRMIALYDHVRSGIEYPRGEL